MRYVSDIKVKINGGNVDIFSGRTKTIIINSALIHIYIYIYLPEEKGYGIVYFISVFCSEGVVENDKHPE